MNKIDGGCRPDAIVEVFTPPLQTVAPKRRPRQSSTGSYRDCVLYIASLRCWCATQPELCTPCVARATVARVTQTPDPGAVKRCSRCQQFKHADGFFPDKRYVTGLSSECRSCSAEYHRQARQIRAMRKAGAL